MLLNNYFLFSINIQHFLQNQCKQFQTFQTQKSFLISFYNSKHIRVNEMFSCFCAKSKRDSHPDIKPSQIYGKYVSNPKLQDENQKSVGSSPTMHTPQILQTKAFQNNQINQITQQKTKEYVPFHKITSLREQENQSKFSLDCSFEQDSQTVPYISKKQMSEVSTPIKRKYASKIQKKGKIYESQVKESSIFRSFSKTNQQNAIQNYFSREAEQEHSHSKFSLFSLNKKVSNNGSASIDYSKYSQHDRKVTSNQILELDEQIEIHLNELDKMPFEEAQAKVSSSHFLNKPCDLHSSLRSHSKFRQMHKYEKIQNDLGEFQRLQTKIPKKLQKKTNLFIKSQYKGSLNIFKLQKKQSNTIEDQKNQQKNQKQQQLLKMTMQIVERTVQTELQAIQQGFSGLFLTLKPTLPTPQDIEFYRKQGVDQFEGIDMMQTLQNAQNSFYCNSINEQFSRALITKNIKLCLQIFERMTYYQRNMKDLKGYCPVILSVLSAITDDRSFQMCKQLIFHPDIKMNVRGPTGWSPLQQAISYKHIRLTPNVFVATHKKNINLIKDSLKQMSTIFSGIKDFQMSLDVKVDSFIPLLSSLTPNDTITITKKANQLLIDYTLVGYEFLSCKRRDMGFLLDGNTNTIYAINRSKRTYCDLLEQLNKQEIQMLVVETLQSETKKIEPIIKNMDMKQARTIFDNEIIQDINSYSAKKYNFSLNYTSMTQKRIPEKIFPNENNSSPLHFLNSWQEYLSHEPKVHIKPKNKNKKVELSMWLSDQFQFDSLNLIKIFELFALSNPLAKIISEFLSSRFQSLSVLKDKFPVKIDVPINFSLFFNLEFRGLKFNDFGKNTLDIENNLKKIPRKQFQNIAQSKQKRAFAVSAFT